MGIDILSSKTGKVVTVVIVVLVIVSISVPIYISTLERDSGASENGKTAQEDNVYTSNGSLTFANKKFYLNGSQIRLISGAVHYFRTFPSYWKDRLLKLKSCGMNTVET